jgi:Thioredoxin
MESNWKKLIHTFKKHSKDIHFGRFDCTIFRPICEGIGITKYPTLVWMEEGKIVKVYKSKQDFKHMKQFISMMSIEAKRRALIDGITTTVSTTLKNNASSSVSLQTNSSEIVKKLIENSNNMTTRFIQQWGLFYSAYW